MKKKILITLFTLIYILSIMPQNIVMASDSDVTEYNWVQKAFGAASSFLNEDAKIKDSSMDGKVLSAFQILIKAINRILLVALFGLSTISLSIIGVKYMVSGGAPHQKEQAKHSLHTLFIGMAYGFGAFAIWKVSMAIVKMVIGSFGTE